MQPTMHFSVTLPFLAGRASSSANVTRFAVFTICLAVAIADAASPSSHPGKIVYQYAVTSANDFPQRDPLDWRFLGSNDGGKTWTTLDSRKDEHFQSRHLRRLFKISHPAKFEIYRLEIDKILDR